MLSGRHIWIASTSEYAKMIIGGMTMVKGESGSIEVETFGEKNVM